MASIPSTGSLIATHDYYRRRLGSASSNSSCGSSEHVGEVIPHHPGLPKSTSGQWWISFFFGKTQNHPVMITLSESPERDKISCVLPPEMMKKPELMRKRHASEPTKPSAGSSS
uniref:Pancreatic progenitor cell differentiation and proliferation factor-like protein n=1 Tax=Callorhinchus milii TaxID=7868 RepID=K4G3F4_CALMI|nr:pancreatic progenitor cell differentiation and proliferation factor-like protein [Callorhinchus milii]